MSFTRLMVRVSGVAMAASLIAAPAFASVHVNQSNTLTGPGSYNSNSAKINGNGGGSWCCGSSHGSTTNTANVTNDILIIGNTGGNRQDHNTVVGGGIHTGDVSANVRIHNNLN